MTKSKKRSCPVCKASTQYQKIKSSKIYKLKTNKKFFQCTKCELIYLYPTFTKKIIDSFYKNDFEKFMHNRVASDIDWSDPKKHSFSNNDNVLRRLKFLKKYLNKNKSILEIGCSSGFMLDAFKSRKMKTMGIEPSKIARTYLKEKDYIVYESIEDLAKKQPGIKFDVICSFMVFEHIKNPIDFLNKQFKILKRGGVIIAEIPCANDPLLELYNIPSFNDFYWIMPHYYYYTPKSIKKLLSKIKCNYKLIPEQRFDLSNHIGWMLYKKPTGNQNYYSKFFSKKTINSYKNDLKKNWLCDTFFLYLWK